MTTTRRSVAAALIAVLSCLLLPLAMVSSWVAGVVTDTDRYVSTVAPLASDPAVKKSVERELNRVVLQAIDVPRQRAAIASLLDARGVEERLRPGVEPLADLLEELVGDTVARAVHRIVDSPRFAEAWEAANRSAHRQLVSALRGESAVLDDQGRVTIDLATLVASALDAVGASLPAAVDRIPDIEASFPLVSSSELARARVGYRALDAVGFWLPLAWLLCVATALLVAPSRRRVLGILGYGGVLGLVVTAVGLAVARGLALDAVPDRALAEAVWQQVLGPLHGAVRVGLAAALALLALRWVTGPGVRAVVASGPGASSWALLQRHRAAVVTSVALVALAVAAWAVL